MNVLLLGDSIRLFYNDAVEEKLGSDYYVYSPEENCRFAAFTLNSLRFECDDNIEWNWGKHDDEHYQDEIRV